MSLDNLIPLVKKSRSPLSTHDFHKEINVVFHDIESEQYDQIHKDMWEVLLQQFSLMVDDFSSHLPDRKLVLMDVGCGTGLGTDLILSTPLGKAIQKVILVDVSPKMMEKAIQRGKSWGIEIESQVGLLKDVPQRADLILTSSVLHHIPELPDFINEVIVHLNSGGVFFHIHDPNGDQLNSQIIRSRFQQVKALDRVNSVYDWLNSSPFLKSIFHSLNRLRGKKNHIDRVNDYLLSKGFIKKRLTAKEIWSVTDIHVEGLPYSTQKGISLNEINSMLPGFQLVGHRTYGFFSRLGYELTPEYREKEQNLILEESKEGRYLTAAWQKN